MKSRLKWPGRGSLAWLALPALGVVAWVLQPPGVRVEVQALRWRYEIEVEQLRAETDSDWCDALPSAAAVIDRRLITEPHPDHATPAERCRYTTMAWRTLWLAHAEGLRGDGPRWPRPPLALAPAGQPGSERLGRREAFHEAVLVASDGKTWTCRLDLERWQRQPLGEHLRLPVDRFGVANCGRLGA
jgi:hypothetical protein